MTTQEFRLKGQPFIPLNNLLQVTGIAQTGGHAKLLIKNEEVLVNGTVETRIRKKLAASDCVEVGTYTIRILG